MKNNILFRLKSKIVFSILLLGLLTNFFFLSMNSQELSSQENVPSIIDNLKNHVLFLASDELEGRYPGTDGNTKAADYIVTQFEKYGIMPINNNYKQEFEFIAELALGSNNIVEFTKLVERPGLPKDMWRTSTRTWTTGSDWQPMRFSDNGKVSGELVFAGFGISAKDINYDDYDGVDVKGKIVIVLSDSAEGKPLDERFLPYSELKYKAINAREHGAVGIIFVKTLSDSANTYYKQFVERTAKNIGIIAIQANRTEISKFFPPKQNLYPVELGMNKTKLPNSFLIPNTTVTISVELGEVKKKISNVVGMVKGTSPELNKEYIVVGAHFDHLGWGENGNPKYRGKEALIYNGADDNASGVATMLELARYTAQNPLKRTVIFIGFNAEEEGLKGSSYFVNNPMLSLENNVAMLNLDMVGRLKDNKINVLGTNSSTGFDQLLDSLALVDSILINKVKEAYSPSDHASFYMKKIPVLFFFTGIHLDYHKPSDDIDKISFSGMEHILKYAYSIIKSIGIADRKPDFIETTTRPDDVGEQKEGHGAWLGIVPNFEEHPRGFKISGVSPGSPAQKAGLKTDDIIMQIDGKAIKNLSNLFYVLKDYKPGDKVKILILRGTKELTVDVELSKK